MSFVRVGQLLPIFAKHGVRRTSMEMIRGYAQMAFTFASSSNVRSSRLFFLCGHAKAGGKMRICGPADVRILNR